MQKRRQYKPRPPRVPSLRLHKASKQGITTLNGHDIYLGPFEEPETTRKYHALIAEWISGGRVLHPEPKQISVSETCLAYWKFAQTYYVDGAGNPTSTISWVEEVVRTLRTLYGPENAAEFSPRKLKACCQVWIDRGLSRRTGNAYLQTAKRLFKWAAAEELIPGDVNHALDAVAGLKRGRSEARETEAVKPVSEAHIEAVRSFVSRQVNALISLQLLCGSRGGELLGLRPRDIDTSGKIWIARPTEHKLKYRGDERQLYLGPKAQAILKPFMLRDVGKYLFSPREAEVERNGKAECHRRPDQKPDPKKTGRRVGERYTSDSYRRAIQRACERAGVALWSPHQLRHSAATAIRKEFGIEAAQLILGHSNGAITEVYAERDRDKAFQIIAEIG